MKKEMIKKYILMATPVFILLLYLLPFYAYYKEVSSLGIESKVSVSYYSLFSSSVNITTKVILAISIACLVSSLVLMVLTFFIKKLEKKFIYYGLLVSLIGVGINYVAGMIVTSRDIGVAILSLGVNFFTIPATIVLGYVITVFYIYYKKEIKK